MKNLFVRFAQDDQGQDLVEYGLLLGVITVAAITFVTGIGTSVANIFSTANTSISGIPGAK